MAKRDPLGVWLHGRHIAELRSSGPGKVELRYTSEALDTWPSNTPLLSCSLPLGTRRQQAGLFFRGLLPEGQHLQALAAQANLASYDTFGLLARYGKDVAGAAIVADATPRERPGSVAPYTREALEGEVADIKHRPLGIHDDSELSLAGLQDKLLLIELGPGLWGRPIHGRPSTHILKVEDRRYSGMAEMEAACLRIARAAGLTTIDATTETIGNVPCLIVSRFDRRMESGTTVRIHQEDACQALARDPEKEQGAGKYERAGGPTLRDIAQLLDRYARNGPAELTRLASIVAFTVLIGNADAHGKNIGLVHAMPGDVRLAPLYDTVPTALWPKLRDRAAMTVNGQQRLESVTLDDIAAEALRWPWDPDLARAAAISTTEAVLEALESTGAPGQLVDLITYRSAALLP